MRAEYDMTTHDVPPDESVEKYLQSRHDITESTRSNHRYRLGLFTQWAQEHGIDTISELTGYDIQQYHNWRHSEDAPDCAQVTIQQHMHSLRVYLRWAERAELVADGLADRVPIRTVSADERSRDDTVAHERATEIISDLAQYQWASTNHILFGLLYHCGMRRSALRGLDVDDWHPDKRYLQIKNRAEEGTRIKLGAEGERHVTVHDSELADAIDDWIANVRPDVTDDYGRDPLMATQHGRMHSTTISKKCYKLTRPCEVTGDCPHDREIDDCEATVARHASKCPSSRGPHSLRRASITHHLDRDIPKEIVSARMSVSKPVLSQHYDARDEESKRESRAQHLDRLN